ncbi:dTDP-4-dehydrorhamnose 3,5-epimerase [archaeon BMS3Bbin15]|nr:dTDP-4-dehydrorhamnose 3,5-epimerase [archaeon BMS3Bbin15]
MKFRKGDLEGVMVKELRKFIDERGWLAELFRQDEIDKESYPVMSYVSMTMPGVTRGPHEHIEQTDYFCFLGPSNFKLVLWDNRRDSTTYMNERVLFVGEDNPVAVQVPPGVVHAYRNIGLDPGYVFNFPNRLFAGRDKKEKVDEIRYENDEEGIFRVDEE